MEDLIGSESSTHCAALDCTVSEMNNGETELIPEKGSEYVCGPCSQTFKKASTLRGHRRREHAAELHMTYNEETFSILRIEGKFRCPLVGCLKNYTNIDTFAAHAKDHTKAMEVNIAAMDENLSTATKSLKRRKLAADAASFTAREGSQKALKMSTEHQSAKMTDALYCEPVALHLSHDSMDSPHSLYGIFHVNDVNETRVKVPSDSSSPSTTSPLTCVLQFQSEVNTIIPADADESLNTDDQANHLRQAVRNSLMPKLLEKNGDYTEPSAELLDFLNFEFSAHPSLLYAVAKLHTGAFFVDKEVVFIIVAEAYSRSKSTDIHSESDEKSAPTVSNSKYGALCAGVFNESDGGANKRKLKIGSRTMNLLITMSARVRSEKPLDVGPEVTSTPHQIRPKIATIFYRVEEVNRFKEIMHDAFAYTLPRSIMTITSLRQLTSSFGDPSTFAPWRAVQCEFHKELTMPTTIFSLCNMPNNQGYGSSGTAVGKIASRFLQCLAISVLFEKTKSEFKTALEAYKTAAGVKEIESKGSTSKAWDTLSTFVCSLEDFLQRHEEVTPSVLASILNFSTLADLASTNVVTSNAKVKEEVFMRLKELYDD